MTATVFDVQERLPGRSYLAGLDHFRLRRTEEVPAENLLENPQITLYAFDDEGRNAVLVETPPGIDLTAAPFYYLAQKEHAGRVYTLPYETFNDLARTLPNPAHLVLLHSVGRCGSTLLCRALGELGNVVTLSEPDAYTWVPGIRPRDGSRDAELTELVRSATRFHAANTGSGTLLLKFRGWCLEMADLLHAAFPDADALFLGRDLPGWLRSMGRLVRLGDPEREAHYRDNRGSLTMYTFPRDQYVSLLCTDPTPPETRLGDIALGWTSLTKRYLDLFEKGVVTRSLTFADLTEHPEHSLRAVGDALHLPLTELGNALGTFAHDSQAGTHLSGRTLREHKLYELSDEDIRQAEMLARRYGLEPDLAQNLPGNLLSA